MARYPFADIGRTVAKDDAVAFAFPQEPDSLAIDEDDVLKIQHERQFQWFRGQKRGQFARVVGCESTAHREHDVTICRALNLQHDAREESNGEASTRR